MRDDAVLGRALPLDRGLGPHTHTNNTHNCTLGSNLANLSKLHWLPVHHRIKFKIATMTH